MKKLELLCKGLKNLILFFTVAVLGFLIGYAVFVGVPLLLITSLILDLALIVALVQSIEEDVKDEE